MSAKGRKEGKAWGFYKTNGWTGFIQLQVLGYSD